MKVYRDKRSLSGHFSSPIPPEILFRLIQIRNNSSSQDQIKFVSFLIMRPEIQETKRQNLVQRISVSFYSLGKTKPQIHSYAAVSPPSVCSENWPPI